MIGRGFVLLFAGLIIFVVLNKVFGAETAISIAKAIPDIVGFLLAAVAVVFGLCILMAAFGFATKVYQWGRSLRDGFVRRSEHTHDVSNDKFVEKLLDRADALADDARPGWALSLDHADASALERVEKYQDFYVKLSDPAISAYEADTGRSYGFRFAFYRLRASSCRIELIEGMNDKMKVLTSTQTGSLETAAQWVADQAIRTSDSCVKKQTARARAA